MRRQNLEHAEEEESLMLEGDIGGGLVFQRLICIPKDDPKVVRINSSIIARDVGAGSGGFSRFVSQKKKTLLFIVCLQLLASFSGQISYEYHIHGCAHILILVNLQSWVDSAGQISFSFL